MDPLDNPYAPGAGTRPPELAGREPQLQHFRLLLARVAAGRPERSLIITGLRGVGKTVLLNEFEHLADEADWFPVFKEMPADRQRPFRDEIAEMGRRVLLAMGRREHLKTAVRRALGVLKSFGVRATVKDPHGIEWSVGIEAVQGVADSGNLDLDLADLFVEIGSVAKGRRTGVMFLFDEVQHLRREELSALIMALHRANQRNVPVTLLAAGLPQLPRLATEAQSYAERLFRFERIGALDGQAARAALEIPARAQGVSFESDALSLIVERSEGYPYFLQEWGREVWDLTAGPPITVADVERASADVERALDQGFFDVRAARATGNERRFMLAMAALGDGPYRSGEIAKALGLTVQAASVSRDRLIKKGLVYSAERGQIAFTVPHFGRFLLGREE